MSENSFSFNLVLFFFFFFKKIEYCTQVMMISYSPYKAIQNEPKVWNCE